MNGWDAGYLHLECLEKRLGRRARWGDDLLVRVVGPWNHGVTAEAHPDYLTSPEYLEHSGE